MAQLVMYYQTSSPMMEVVSETGRRLKGIVPSVTGKLQQVDTVLKASLSDMGSAVSSDPEAGNQEVKKILEEANKAAEDAVRSKFPEFPSELTAELEKPKVPVAIAEGVGEVAVEKTCQRTGLRLPQETEWATQHRRMCHRLGRDTKRSGADNTWS